MSNLVIMRLCVDTRKPSAMVVANVGISRELVGVSPGDREQDPHGWGRIGGDPAQYIRWMKVSQRKKVNFPCIMSLLKASQRKMNFTCITLLLANRLIVQVEGQNVLMEIDTGA